MSAIGQLSDLVEESNVEALAIEVVRRRVDDSIALRQRDGVPCLHGMTMLKVAIFDTIG